jgi:hypothetical protein
VRVLPFVLLLALGCADKTGILIEVRSDDLVVPDDIDQLRFEATSTGEHTIDELFAIDNDWPHSLTILPFDDTDGAITVTVTGSRDGAFQVRRVVSGLAFERGATRRVEVLLTDDCVGVQCEVGVDCVRGICVGDPPLEDGGVDAGMDGGMIADGGTDAGMANDDAGMDAGMMDGGTDAGMVMTDGGRDAGPFDGGMGPRIILSEYVEGNSLNKALELRNMSGASMSLAACELRRYANGATTFETIPLAGMIGAPPNDVFVICHTGFDTTLIGTLCDQTHARIDHTGDDTYELRCDGTTIDSFGRIGLPRENWMGGGLSGAEHVLTRRCAVTSGDINASDTFTLNVEWQGTSWVDPATSLGGLGNHTECP